MKLLKYIGFAIICLILSSCHKDDPAPLPQKARRTVIMYMMAENSLASYTNLDLREILSAKGDIPLDCNMVVYLDDAQMPRIYTYSAQTGCSVWKNLNEENSCDSLVFRKNLANIIKAFPAEHYGLILWSHGSGWIPQPTRTVGIDNNYNNTTNTGTELEIPAMKRALESLGVHWDYIFFDACFMQSIEVAYELRNVCDYVIGSPAEIPGEGAPYHKIMTSLFADTLAAKDICTNYFDTYKDNDGLIISAVKTSELEELARRTRPIVQEAYHEGNSIYFNNVQPYCAYHSNTVWKPEYYDIASALHYISTNPTYYLSWQEQMGKVLEAEYHSAFWFSIYSKYFIPRIIDPEHISSVSMFFPHRKYEAFDYNQALRDYEWYNAVGWNETGW